MNDTTNLLSLREAAKLLNLSYVRVTQMVHEGKFKTVAIPSSINKIPMEEVLEYKRTHGKLVRISYDDYEEMQESQPASV